MNNAQLKYAVGRGAGIYKRIQKDLAATFEIPAVYLSETAKIDAIGKGEFTLNDSRHYHWYERVKFNGEHSAYNLPGYEEAKTAARKAYDDLLDALVLGSSSEGVALLAAFEQWTLTA